MSEATNSTEFPVEPLEELHLQHGSKDNLAQVAVAQLVSSLVEYGVSPLDVRYHLLEAANKVK